MFSKSLLPLITRHDFQLFDGASEWPANEYGRDGYNLYERRESLRPLFPEDLYLDEAINEAGPTSYVVKFSSEGEFKIESI